MKIVSTKFLLASAIFGLGFSANAAETRFIVHMNSPRAFSDAQLSLKKALSEKITRKDMFGRISIERPSLLNTHAAIAQAFENLDMLVIETSSSADVAALRANPNVAYVEQDRLIPLLEPTRSNPGTPSTITADDEELPWGIKSVKAPEAWQAAAASSGLMGASARVLILDTGIDKDHPDLKNRFEAGKNFVNHIESIDPGPSSSNLFLSMREVFDNPGGPNFDSTTPPYEYFDQEGHGTHVSGTIAGELDDKGVVGVAPKAKLLMGRVCGKFGCSVISIVNGINWAITQKVDVISMSLGGPSSSQSQEDALAASEAANIVNVAASGNSSTNSVSFPAAYPTCLAVGAINNQNKKAEFSQWGPELDIMGPGVDVKSSVPQGSGRDSKVQVSLNGQMQDVPSTSFMGSPEVNTPMSGTLQFAGLGKSEDFAGKDFKGKVALISRGEIAFSEKVKNAIAAGAKAALVFNNVAGLISGSLTTDGSMVAIPVVMVEQVTGEALRDSLGGGRAEQVTMATLKTNYASFSGTSMATPHLAGVAALIKAVNHKLTPAQVRQIITSTAVALEQTADNQYGSGLVNAQAAVEAALKTR